jgi:hypothetical protein
MNKSSFLAFVIKLLDLILLVCLIVGVIYAYGVAQHADYIRRKYPRQCISEDDITGYRFCHSDLNK